MPVSGCWLLWVTTHLPAVIRWNPRPSSDSSRTHVTGPWWRHRGTYTWRRWRRRRRRPSRARSRTRKSAPRLVSPGRYPGGRWSVSPHNSVLQHKTQRITHIWKYLIPVSFKPFSVTGPVNVQCKWFLYKMKSLVLSSIKGIKICQLQFAYRNFVLEVFSWEELHQTIEIILTS